MSGGGIDLHTFIKPNPFEYFVGEINALDSSTKVFSLIISFIFFINGEMFRQALLCRSCFLTRVNSHPQVTFWMSAHSLSL